MHRRHLCKVAFAYIAARRASRVLSSQATASPGLRLRHICDTAVLSLLLAPAALAQPQTQTQGSSAVSDLLARKSKKSAPAPAGPSQAAESSAPSSVPESVAPSSLESTVQSKATQVSEASSAKQAASVLPETSQAPESLNQAASQLSSKASDAADQANSAVSKLQESTGSSGSSLQDSAADAAKSVQSAVGMVHAIPVNACHATDVTHVAGGEPQCSLTA